MHQSLATRSLGVVSMLLLAACGDSGTTTTNTTVVSPVAVSAVFPAEARAGETITVSGQRFGATQGTNTLSINGAVATQIASWSDTQIVATVPTDATTGNVTVTVDGVAGAPGHLVVLWQATNPANVAVSAATGDQNAPQLIADGAGGAFMVWEDLRNGSANVYAQRFNNAGRPLWAAGGVAVGVPFAFSQFGIITPQLIADGAGGAIVVWSDSRDGVLKVYAQRLNGAGEAQWAAGGVRVSTLINTQLKPQLTSDGAGGVVVAWYVLAAPNGGQPGTYAQRLDATGAAQWVAEGVFIGPQFDIDTFGIGQRRNRGPALIPDGTGGAFIASSNGSASTNSNSAIQRINGAGAVQWPAGGVLLTASIVSSFTVHPQLAPDGAQGAIVVTQANVGNRIAILAQRLDGAGTKLWGTDGVRVGFDSQVVADAARAPSLVADGAGGAIVAWRAGLGPNYDIRAQRVNGAGVAQWTFNGVDTVTGAILPVAVSTAAGTTSNPRLIADGADGAIVVWADARSGDNDIYTERLNNAGVAQWPTATVISTAVGDQTAPQIVPDGYGGAIAVWQDRRDGNNDIYAQRIGASGRQ